MSFLVNLNLVKSPNKSSRIFESVFPNILNETYSSPREFMDLNWKKYIKSQHISRNDNSVNGIIFEYLLGVLFSLEGLKPLFISAKVAFVPNVIFDFLFYEKSIGPICISAKTSLRERYKQADLEAMALKNVHRRAKSYLVVIDEKEATSVKKKVISGDVLGLNDVYCAISAEFDTLIANLKASLLITPESVEVITANKIIK